MSYVAELVRELQREGDRPASLSDIARALGEVADRTEDTRRFLDALQDRLLIVDELPETAPFGALIRRRGQAALFLGNGPSQPLSRLVPQAV